MMADREIQALTNWAVWAHLDNYTEVELIILKGHLLIERVLSSETSSEQISFHGKVTRYRSMGGNPKIADFLQELNNIRNQLAHEWPFYEGRDAIAGWALSVLDSFNPIYYTRRTYRTRIVHAFSTLAYELYGSIRGFGGVPAIERVSVDTLIEK